MLKFLMILFSLCTFLLANEPIVPIPQVVKYDKAKAQLGKKLFYDTRLSKDGTVACVVCHNLSNGGADPRKVSHGVYDRLGNIQSPTVYNARYNFKQFWNGRAANLKEQAKGPLENPNEHGMNPQLIEKRLNASQEYRKLFQQIYHTRKIKFNEVTDAIAAFEKALVTPNAKFDRYLRGEVQLTPEEKDGYRLFKEYGCITCHDGINIGGNSFQKMGTFFPYDTNASYPDRGELLKNSNYHNVFKVPTLRNIALTAPYFHDGSAKTLAEAVKIMAHANLGIEFSDKETREIVSFLKTLTGQKPKIVEQP